METQPRIPQKLFHDAIRNNSNLKGLDAVRFRMINNFIMLADLSHEGCGVWLVIASPVKDKINFRLVDLPCTYDDF